jgi:hypothetical protein
MKKLVQRFLMVMVIMASFCGSALAQQAGKDWYVALRLGYQPFTMEADGTVLNRDFHNKADLSDIQDKMDTTLGGLDIEFGKGNWFGILQALYFKVETKEGSQANGNTAMLKQVVFSPTVGYRVYQGKFEGNQSLTIDALAGLSYIKTSWDLSLFDTVKGNLSQSNDFETFDPMIGARLRYMFTKQFGMAAQGQIGGFGVGTELQYIAAANLIYAFTDWFALSAGYKYWYFKYEDDGANLSKLEQKIYGPTIGVQFTF